MLIFNILPNNKHSENLIEIIILLKLASKFIFVTFYELQSINVYSIDESIIIYNSREHILKINK